MEDLDLDISHYQLDDILRLFKLTCDFDEEDLKNAKKIVLRTHPDKSNLKHEYFLFFSKAYKTLYQVYLFKNKSIHKKIHTLEPEDGSEEKNSALNSFFEKNKTLKKPTHFNKWFNEQFEKNKMSLESDAKGYGEWLKSDEDLEDEIHNVSKATMMEEFNKKKQKVRSLVVYKDINDMYYNNINSSNLTGQAPEEFSSDVFSSLPYQDLRQAHKESVIPVTDEDYINTRKFNSVTEYTNYRSSQDTAPLSESQAMEFLKNKNMMSDKDSNMRAYELAKQTEEVKRTNKNFWGNIKSIQN